MSDIHQLLPVTLRSIGSEQINAVSARDLHAFLGSKDDFSTWIKYQIERARLVEHRDFEVFRNIPGNAGGRPRQEYALAIESAKHIGMMSGTDKGFEVRDYFIECERVAQAPVDPIRSLLTMGRSEILELALGIARERDGLRAEVDALEPKALALDRIATADHGSMAVTNAAKALQVPPKKFFFALSEMHWIYRRAGGSGWIAYQDKIQAGYLEHKVTTISKGDGTEKVVEQVLVTPKGLAKLARLLHREGFQPSLGMEA